MARAERLSFTSSNKQPISGPKPGMVMTFAKQSSARRLDPNLFLNFWSVLVRTVVPIGIHGSKTDRRTDGQPAAEVV